MGAAETHPLQFFEPASIAIEVSPSGLEHPLLLSLLQSPPLDDLYMRFVAVGRVAIRNLYEEGHDGGAFKWRSSCGPQRTNQVVQRIARQAVASSQQV